MTTYPSHITFSITKSAMPEWYTDYNRIMMACDANFLINPDDVVIPRKFTLKYLENEYRFDRDAPLSRKDIAFLIFESIKYPSSILGLEYINTQSDGYSTYNLLYEGN